MKRIDFVNVFTYRRFFMKAYCTSQGNWQINFTFSGKQRTLYLGRHFTPVLATRAARVIDELVSVRKCGAEPEPDLLSRVGTLPPKVRGSLERLGLLSGCFGLSIDELYERFFAAKLYRNKGTLSNYSDSRRYLSSYFGIDRPISTITQGDVEAFRLKLCEKLSASTLSGAFRRLRTVFKFAVSQGYLSENPFLVLVQRVDTDEKRQHYVSRELMFRLWGFCRDDRERLALALGRFAGLRIPSEVFALRFRDFKDDAICIADDTKTGSREVPLFREVRDIFVRLSGEPDELIFDGWGKYRFRKFLLSALTRSGIDAWVKLWVNLRSSFITDLSKLGYDERTMDAICGNSAKVRRVHYIQFERRAAYAKVLADNERICGGISVTKMSEQGQFELLLQELAVLRKLLVGVSTPPFQSEKE